MTVGPGRRGWYVPRRLPEEVPPAEPPEVDFLSGPLPSYLFLPARVWEGLSARVGRPCRLVARHYDLYDHRDIVVVSNEVTPAAETARAAR